MANTKMTERELLNAVIDGTVDTDALVEYAEKRIAQLDKRNASAAKRAASKRAAGDELTEKVFSVLSDEPMNREMVLEALEDESLTLGKVTARLTRLVNEGRANKTKGKVVGEDGKKHDTTLYVIA